MFRPWRPDDLVVLRRNYGNSSTGWLCQYLDRSPEDIEAKATQLRLAKDKRRFPGRTMPRWTELELRLLRVRYPTRSNQEIALELNKSTKSVQTMGQRLGLRKDRVRLCEMGHANASLRRDKLRP